MGAAYRFIHTVVRYRMREAEVATSKTITLVMAVLVLSPLLALKGCSTSSPGLPSLPTDSAVTKPASSGTASDGAMDSSRLVVRRPASRWVPVDWQELAGWQQDRQGQALHALMRSCHRAQPAWRQACAAALLVDPSDDEAVRAWAQAHLQPWRIEDNDGRREGLLTGYFEPLFEARRQADAVFRAPVHAPPADLAQRRPYWSRQQLDTVPEARAGLRGKAIAHLADPIDVLVLQIQGSGRLRITESDGREQTVRLAFAGHNDHPYQSVGRWLADRGELPLQLASWPGIRDWARRNPSRIQEMLWANPRVVFFAEEPLPDPGLGPRGAQGVPLTPQRSIAVDPRSIPYGTPLWLQGADPQGRVLLQRLVVAQDTGGAIIGAVRGDYFWGWGDEAEQQASRMKQQLRLWALWPRGARVPEQ